MGDAHKHQTSTSAVAEALEQNAGLLRAFVSGRVARDDVDDVLQAAALRAVERSETLHDPNRVLPWLYRIHRNTITDLWRQTSSLERLKASQEALDTQPEVFDASCDCSLVQTQRLRPSYASVLTLVDVGDASLAEAAKALGISVNNVTVRLHRARKALRQLMQDHCGVGNLRDCLGCRCIDDGCCAA